MQEIARQFKRLRKQRGLTQEALAERLHVTRQAVSNWERGENLPDLELLVAAAEALEVPVDELLYGPRPGKVGAPDNQRRRVLTAACLWTAWVVLLVLHLVMARGVAEVFARIYRPPVTYWVDRFLLWPVLCLTLGMAVCALVCIWRDLHPKRLLFRRLLFGAGLWGTALLLLLVLFLPGWTYMLGLWPRFMGPWLACTNLYNSGTFHLLCGALLFCGWRRKAG